MSAVDVLAVMDAAALSLANAGDARSAISANKARAAVAELIAASKAAIVLCTEACEHSNPAMRQDAILRRDALAAALARCKGETA